MSVLTNDDIKFALGRHKKMVNKALLLVCGSLAVADAFSPSFSQLSFRSVSCSMAKSSAGIGRRDLLRGE